jgi:hypothetical protein
LKSKADEEIRYLEARELAFEKTEGGFLSLKIGRKRYPRVNLYRSFPLSHRNSYISVRDDKDGEIGILESLGEFSRGIRRLIEEELERRYFSPTIHEVISLKEEFGYSYWDVRTDAGSVRFTVRSGENNIVVLSDGKLLIIDVDGNRFELPDQEKMAPKYRKILESLV